MAAVLPPKPADGKKNSAFRRVCRALDITERRGKAKGKPRPSSAAQQSQERRTSIDRMYDGQFRVGDWVISRGAGKGRSLHTTEVPVDVA